MEIVKLALAAFKAKKTHGPDSEEFKSAHLAVFAEIDKHCEAGSSEVFPVDPSDSPHPRCIGVWVKKIERSDIPKEKIRPVDCCGYSLAFERPKNLGISEKK